MDVVQFFGTRNRGCQAPSLPSPIRIGDLALGEGRGFWGIGSGPYALLGIRTAANPP